MPRPINKAKYNLKENLEDKFIAFIDVMGFSHLVNNGNVEELDSYFSKITDELKGIKIDKERLQCVLISDSIILISPKGLLGLTQLITAIQRIQSALLWRNILLRGAVTFGQVFYHPKDNIIVGKGFIKAFLLENEAVFPRVIIDPNIIKLVSDDRVAFEKLINKTTDYNFEKRLIYTKSKYSEIPYDGIFIDYANKTIQKESLNGNIKKVYSLIKYNLYSDQKLYSKYVWLRDYFIEILSLTDSLTKEESVESRKYKSELGEWLEKFSRL